MMGMKIAIMGCGSIGKRHLENILSISPTTQIIAYDSDKTQLKLVVQAHPNISITTELEYIWQQSPQIVIIALPTSLHISYALLAAKNNCHLFIEKPLSHSLIGISKLIKLTEQKKLVSLIGCNLRFHWAIQKIKELLDKKIIGKVLSANFSSGSFLPDWHPKTDYRLLYSAQQKLGGGVILDAIHELDYPCWFFGEIKQIIGMYGKISNLMIDTEDCADMIIQFKFGPIATIHMDYLHRDYHRRSTIVGENGTIEWDFMLHTVRLYRAIEKKWEEFNEPNGYDFNQVYIDEIKYFMNCVRKGLGTFNDIVFARKILSYALQFKQKGIYVN
jgi:predicted dehydrogenase